MVKKKKKSEQVESISSNNKDKKTHLTGAIFVSATTFFSGASVMIVELSASRLLAPLFGNTLYTWTSLIGVLLLCLSIGYYLGGAIADKYPKISTFLTLIGLSGLCVLIIVPLHRAIENWLETFSIITGPIVATLIIFSFAGLLLGTITPVAIKLLSDKLDRVGLSAGIISMISTIGSFIGTFLAGFVLVPHMKLTTIFYTIGITLIVLCIAGFLIFRGSNKIKTSVIGIIVFAGLILSLFYLKEAQLPSEVLFQKYTYYHRINVEKANAGSDNIYTLKLDTTYEGAQFEKSPEMVFTYTKYYKLYKLFVPHLKKAIFLGGGAYSMPEALQSDEPDAEVSVVEIDPEIQNVGKQFFKLSLFPRLKLITADARRYLFNSKQRYDLIFGDAYRGPRNIPAHLVTKEFFTLVKDRLSPDGAYMMNLISAISDEEGVLFQSIAKTLNSVFPNIYLFPTTPNLPYNYAQNLIIVATKNKIPYSELQKRAEQSNDQSLKDYLATYMSQKEWDSQLANGEILTDFYNPIEYLVAIHLDENE